MARGKLEIRKKARKAAKKRIYRTDPKKANLAVLARREDKLAQFRVEAEVMRLVRAGNTYEQVAEKINVKIPDLGMSTKEALELTKKTLDKWCSEISLDAKQNRELDLQRIDAVMLLLWENMQPKPLFGKNGRPMLDFETGEQVTGPPDLESIKVYNMMLDRRAKLLGLNPETSAIVVNNQVNIVERRYIGVDPEDL